MEGQCKWYSCPFRHISRQEFAIEVNDLLHTHFSKMTRPNSEHRPMGNRMTGGDLYTSGSQMLPDRGYQQSIHDRYPQSVFERQQGGQDPYRRPVHERLGGEDYLLPGMSNLSIDSGFDPNQRELNKLRDELKMLNAENEKLRSSVRMMSLEEENRMLRDQQFMVPQSQPFGPGYYQNMVSRVKFSS